MGVKEILCMVSSLLSSISCKFEIPSSWITLLTCHSGFLFGKKEHSLLRCPAFQQWKHNPFLMQHFLSSRVSFPMWIMSTFIVLGSLVLEELEVKG